MATAIGTNTMTSIARHYILPVITDNIYRSNVVLYRLISMSKKIVQGGTQIEVPLMYARFNSGGPYRGLDVFNTTPSDTVKNAVFDWKQHYVTWSVDGLTLIKTDSPDAIANFLMLQSNQAYMEMAENLAVGLAGMGIGTAGSYGATANTDIRDVNGLAGMFGTGSTLGDASYGNIPRASNSWWNASVDNTAAALSMTKIMATFSGASVGGQHPTLIISRADQWNRYWVLQTTGAQTQYPRQPSGHDELLASAGFTNLLFNNVPWVQDSHVPDGTSPTNSAIWMLNENVIAWATSPRADFTLKPFQEPPNQDGMVASLLWAGNFVAMNCATQGCLSAVNA